MASCRRSRFGSGITFLAAALLGAGPLRAQDTGAVVGSLRIAESSTPVAEATIRVEGTLLVATSDADGAFHLFAVPVGTQWLVIDHPGYVSLSHQFVMEVDAQLTLPLFLEPNLAALEAPSRSNRNEIGRDDIARAAQSGQNLIDLIDQHLPSLRIRDDGVVGGGTCVEYRGGAGGSLCRQLGLVVDGVRVTRPQTAFGTIALDDVERIQLLSPSEAGTRFGGVGGWGMLVVETRRGLAAAPVQPVSERAIYGFDWAEESQPYPWAKVLFTTTLTNATALSVSYFTNDCLRVSNKVRHVAIRTECDTWGTLGSVVLMTALPSISSSLAARWAGGTPRSHGRLVPSAVIGSALTVGGYVALLYGDAENSDAASIAGVTILTVAAPVFTTLADRLLRELR